jgi:hypothetical protein
VKLSSLQVQALQELSEAGGRKDWADLLAQHEPYLELGAAVEALLHEDLIEVLAPRGPADPGRWPWEVRPTPPYEPLWIEITEKGRQLL